MLHHPTDSPVYIVLKKYQKINQSAVHYLINLAKYANIDDDIHKMQIRVMLSLTW